MKRAVLLLAAALACGDAAEPGKAAAPLVEVARAERRPIDVEIEAAGVVEAREAVWVASGIAGVIQSVHFAEGQELRFRPGEAPILFRLDTSLLDIEVQGAERRAEASRSEQQEAQARFDRVAMLYAGKAASKAEYDEAKFALERTLAAKRRARDSVQGERRRAGQGIIRAPFPGMVGERLVGPGEFVQPGQRLVEVVDVDEVKVAFAVSAAHLPQLRAGMPVTVTVPGVPGEPRESRLSFVSPRVAETRTVHLHAELENPDRALRPGLAARVRVVLAEDVPALVIPETAVENRGEKVLVYRVEAGKVRAREVVLLRRLRGEVAIASGLEPGDAVVVRGLDRITDGAAVRTRDAGRAERAGEPAPAAPAPAAPGGTEKAPKGAGSAD
jgi:membrane fusion protein, multidrug efflux system